MSSLDQFALSNPLFSAYAFYGSVVILKMLALGPLTTFKRFTAGIFCNPEDAEGFGQPKVIIGDDRVERVRRNHLNDLENIPAFLFLGLLYITTKPTLAAALWHFRIFTASRFIHTFIYQFAIPQPSRALIYYVGIATCLSMGYQIIVATQF
jgi:glutathione S-transferase